MDKSNRAPVVTMQDIMTADVHCIKPEMTVREAVTLITNRKVSGAPVVDQLHTVISVVSEGDLLKLAAAEGLDVTIGHCVQIHKLRKATELLTLRKSSSFADAYSIFVKHGVQRIIITDDNGKLHGIVSRSNVLRLMALNKPAAA